MVGSSSFLTSSRRLPLILWTAVVILAGTLWFLGEEARVRTSSSVSDDESSGLVAVRLAKRGREKGVNNKDEEEETGLGRKGRAKETGRSDKSRDGKGKEEETDDGGKPSPIIDAAGALETPSSSLSSEGQPKGKVPIIQVQDPPVDQLVRGEEEVVSSLEADEKGTKSLPRRETPREPSEIPPSSRWNAQENIDPIFRTEPFRKAVKKLASLFNNSHVSTGRHMKYYLREFRGSSGALNKRPQYYFDPPNISEGVYAPVNYTSEIWTETERQWIEVFNNSGIEMTEGINYEQWNRKRELAARLQPTLFWKKFIRTQAQDEGKEVPPEETNAPPTPPTKTTKSVINLSPAPAAAKVPPEMDRMRRKLYPAEMATMQEAYDGIRIALQNGRLMELDPREKIYNQRVPHLAVPCTHVDFPWLLHLLARGLDTGVGHFTFYLNGADPVAAVFLQALRKVLGGRYITIFLQAENQGVSRSWNQILEVAFEYHQPPLPFSMIVNADAFPAAGRLAAFANDTRVRLPSSNQLRNLASANNPPGGVPSSLEQLHGFNRKEHGLLINRLGHFAFFAMTLDGYKTLGKFDENLFPAYGEDVEIHVRATSLGLGGLDHFGKFGENAEGKDFHHTSSTNLAVGGSGFITFNRNAMRAYLTFKWGISMVKVKDFAKSRPYFAPFNDCMIPHTRWAVDPVRRACLMSGKKTSCKPATTSGSVWEKLRVPPEQSPPAVCAFKGRASPYIGQERRNFRVPAGKVSQPKLAYQGRAAEAGKGNKNEEGNEVVVAGERAEVVASPPDSKGTGQSWLLERRKHSVRERALSLRRKRLEREQE